MSATPTVDHHTLESSEDLAAFIEGVRGKASAAAPEEGFVGRTGRVLCALDTEADSLHSYREKLCLVQFAAAGELALIDPLKIEDLGPLRDFIREAEVWMHGADFDIVMLKRAFDEVPEVVLDTQVAARLVGVRKFGLAALLEQFFDVSVCKSSQRADWSRRPLPEKMVAYAVNDVRYILPLAARLLDQLEELGRLPWFEESCVVQRASVLDRPGKSDDDVWRIRGWGRLDRKGLHFLRALWGWRDREAEIRDRPAFKIVGNDLLIDWAMDLQSGRRMNLPHYLRRDQRGRLVAAVDEAAGVPAEQWPRKRRSPRGERLDEDEEAFEAIRKRRDALAESLDLDPSLIATRSALEVLSVRPEEAPNLLMEWQRELLFGGAPDPA